MMNGAYLVVHIVSDGHRSVVTSAGIYSEEHPTTASMSEHTTCLLSAEGNTFETAVRKLKKEAMARSKANKVIAWAMSHVKSAEEARGF